MMICVSVIIIITITIAMLSVLTIAARFASCREEGERQGLSVETYTRFHELRAVGGRIVSDGLGVREHFVDQGVDLRRGEGVGYFQSGHVEVWGGHQPEVYFGFKKYAAIVSQIFDFSLPFPEYMLAIFSFYSFLKDRNKERRRIG
jgi:hypothetical protein